MKGKLTHIDLIFPILAGLKKKEPNIKIKLIFPSKEALSVIKENKALYKSLSDLAEIKNFYFSKEINIPYLPYLFSGIISVIHRNFLVKNLIFQKVYIFRIIDIPRINWLISLNRHLFNGRKISLFLHSFEFDQFMSTVKRVIQIRKTSDPLYSNQLNTDSDTLITSYNYGNLFCFYSYKFNYFSSKIYSCP